MVTQQTYTPVTLADEETNNSQELVHLDVLGLKLDLPNLQDADSLPLELIQAALLYTSHQELTAEQTNYATSVFFAYFESNQPKLWNVLKREKHPMAWISAITRTWAEQSALDPKA